MLSVEPSPNFAGSYDYPKLRTLDISSVLKAGMDLPLYRGLCQNVKEAINKQQKSLIALLNIGMSGKDFSDLKSNEQLFVLEHSANIMQILDKGIPFRSLMACGSREFIIKNPACLHSISDTFDFEEFAKLEKEVQLLLLSDLQDLLGERLQLKAFACEYFRNAVKKNKEGFKKLLQAGISCRDVFSREPVILPELFSNAAAIAWAFSKGKDFKDFTKKSDKERFSLYAQYSDIAIHEVSQKLLLMQGQSKMA